MSESAQTDEKNYGLSAELAAELHKAVDSDDAVGVALLTHDKHPADVAFFIESLDSERRQSFLKLIKSGFDPEILAYVDEELLEEITEVIGVRKSAEAIAELDTEDAIHVFEELEEEEQNQILQALPAEYRASFQELLSYPEDSVGRVMRPVFVSVPDYWNVGQVIDYLRSFEDLPEDFHEIYIVDPKQKPLKSVITSRVLRNKRAAPITSIATDCKQILNPQMDQEEAAHIFRKYAISSAPVVDVNGSLIGVVDIEDIIEVIDEEAEEDFMRLGGVSTRDRYSDLMKTVRRRFPWLGINTLSAFISSFIIAQFVDSISEIVVLAALMPVVAAVSGNAGMQTLTVAISAISGKRQGIRGSWRVIFKESLIGLTNGMLIAVLSGTLVYLIYGNIQLALVFAIAVVFCFIGAGLFGSLVPYTLKAMKIDPAVASTAFVAAITDIISFLIFLGLATIYLVT